MLSFSVRHGTGSKRAKHYRRHPRGQALVEFAVVLPIFLLLVLTAVDFGRLFFSWVQLNNAAREAVAYGAQNPTSTSGMLARAQQEANVQAQGGEHPITLSATCVNTAGTTIPCSAVSGAGGPGNTITVNVSEQFSFLTPMINALFGNGFSIGASASSVALELAPSASGTQPPGCSAPSAALITVSGSGKLINAEGGGSLPNSGLCQISGYNWNFGDGSTDVSYATGTTHTYANAGVYTLTLTVTNQGGSATASTTVSLPMATVCVAPGAVFSIAPASGTAGSTTFNFDANASTNMGVPACHPHYVWSFGDSTAGPDAVTTTHLYAAGQAGKTVTVRLTVSNDAGSGQSVQTIALR